MKTTIPASVSVWRNLMVGSLAVFGMVCWTSAADKKAEPAKPAKAAKAEVASVAVSVPSLEIVMPKSVFVVPTTQKEGRNPFFPEAKVTGQVPKDKQQALDNSSFVLNGITGPPLRSAMINGRTFLAGEEGEVRLQNGAKVMIKCAQIRDESAVIVVGGVQRELRLRFGI